MGREFEGCVLSSLFFFVLVDSEDEGVDLHVLFLFVFVSLFVVLDFENGKWSELL